MEKVCTEQSLHSYTSDSECRYVTLLGPPNVIELVIGSETE